MITILQLRMCNINKIKNEKKIDFFNKKKFLLEANIK